MTFSFALTRGRGSLVVSFLQGEDTLKILITGCFEFVGTQLAFHFQHRGHQVIAADNLVCRGSELNLPRFKRHGIEFVNVDVRHPEDLATLPKGIDLIRDASAQPSVV